jgi:probable F420-dependent oxidoreductase
MARFGVHLSGGIAATSPEMLRALAQHAERWGYDSVWFADHIVIPRTVRSAYPYAVDGVSTFDPDQPMHEVLATLTFLAGCTQHIRLGPDVLIVPYRPPILTAKLLTMLDVLSGGRLTVGVGVGWMEEEFEALGAPPYAERGAVTDEYLRLFKVLWTADHPTFEGRYCSVSDIGFLPKPVQKPHPPIWVGGHTGPALRRAAELGDAWLPLGTFPPVEFRPEELQPRIARLRELTRQAGRPEEAVKVCLGAFVRFEDGLGADRLPLKGSPDQIAEDVRRYQSIGINDFILFLGRGGDTSVVMEAIERFARDVVPLVGGDAPSGVQ